MDCAHNPGSRDILLMSISQQILGVTEDTQGEEAHRKMALDMFIIPNKDRASPKVGL
jgi:hypothetical protein